MRQFLLFALTFAYTFCQAQTTRIPLINSSQLIEEGVKLHEEEKFDEALAKYDAVSRNDSSYALAIYEKTLSYYSKKDYSKAIETANFGFTLKSEYEPLFHLMLAASLDDSGKREEALKAYHKGIDKFPNDFRLHYNKGLVYYRMWKINEAIACVQRAIELNFFHANSHRLLGLICLEQDQPSRAVLSMLTYLTIEPQHSLAADNIIKLEKYLTEDIAYNPDSVLIKIDEEAFQTTDLVLKSHAALNAKFKLQSKLDFKVVRQIQAFLEKLEYDEKSQDFWMKKYVSYYQKLWKSGYFENSVYYWFASVDERAKKKYEKDDSDIKQLKSFASTSFQKISRYKKMALNGKEGLYRVGYHENDFIQSIVSDYDEEKQIIKGYAEFYHPNNALESRGTYDQNGSRTGEWKFYDSKGQLVQITQYYPKDSIVKYQNYFSNGSLSDEGTLKNGEDDGKYTAYYVGGGKKFEVSFEKGKKSGKAFEYFEDGIVDSEAFYKDGMLNGVLKNYHLNGRLLSERTIINDEEDGMYRSYHLNGKPNVVGKMAKNMSEGEWLYYYDNGQISSKVFFENNIKQGAFLTFHPNGVKASEGNYTKGEPTGIHKYYDEDGKISSEESYENGLLKSYKYFDKQGNILSENTRKGEVLDLKAFYPNGAKRIEGKFNKKGRHGTFIEYHESGGKKIESEYLNGMLNGVSKEYSEVGKIITEDTYKNDTLDGYHIQYYSNGKASQEGWFVKGLAQGTWKNYHENGVVKDLIYYQNNKVDGFSEHFYPNGKKENEFYIQNEVTEKVIQFDTTGKIFHTIDVPKGNGNVIMKGISGNKLRELTFKNGNKSGEEVYYYADGTKNLSVNHKHGVEWGLRTFYNIYGNREREYYYKNGVMDSLTRFYYENGKLEFEGFHKENELDGLSKWYSYDGKLETTINFRNGQRHGEYIYFGEDGKTVAFKLMYRNGQIIEYTYLDKNNQWLPPTTVKNGTFDLKAFYPNGKPSYEGSFIKNQRHGLCRYFYMNGNLEAEFNFDLGVNIGEQKEYYISGKPRVIYIEKDDVRNGSFKTFNENGTLKLENNYVSGLLHGKVKEYDNLGKLIRTRNFYYGDEF